MDKHSKLSTSILIFSNLVALLLYITYSIRDKNDPSFNVHRNPRHGNVIIDNLYVGRENPVLKLSH